MVRTTALLAATAAFALDVNAEGMYTKKSGVLSITGMDYDRLIARSNYTSIVEFYAPWCGHCKNLKPAYETVAKSLAGIAKVAAVNCDDEMNKPFCGKMGVKGFPTLKIVRPGKKPGKPIVDDYQGERTAKGIVNAVKDKVPNLVNRLNDKNIDEWLEAQKDSAKAILFSEKGVVSATLKAVAIDFAGLVSVAQVRKTEKQAVEKYGITSFPSLILLQPGSEEPIKFDGKVDKDAMVKFLSQVAPPNPDCPPPTEKKPKAKKDAKASAKPPKAAASPKSADASATEENVEEPNVKGEDKPEPVVLEDVKPVIPVISEATELQALCLNEQSTTCILAILPKDESSEAVGTVIDALATIHHKHDTKKSKLFPFVSVPASNSLAASLLSSLSLGTDDQLHLVATHGKRAWYKKYPGSTFAAAEVEQWVDAIRMGEGKKESLPEALLSSEKKEPEHNEL
ncbi:hypothetical protein ACEQ8H_005156 [Pleosporales sp. CAS-2024a]